MAGIKSGVLVGLLGLALLGCAGKVSEEFTLHSDIVGDDYVITLFEPPQAEPSQPLPVIFLLDADANFGTVSNRFAREVEAGRLPPALLVGVGYGSMFSGERNRDYVLPSSESPQGNVEAFYGFLRQELLPALANRRPLADGPSQRYLIGHSYGGFAALYGLLRHHDFIGHFGAASPSLTYDDWRIVELEAELAPRRSDLPATVSLSSGTQEPGVPVIVQAFADRLRSRGWPSLQVHDELHVGRTHPGGSADASAKALRYLLGQEGTR
jgi:predicted alpha/beta superfamily hydrolase